MISSAPTKVHIGRKVDGRMWEMMDQSMGKLHFAFSPFSFYPDPPACPLNNFYLFILVFLKIKIKINKEAFFLSIEALRASLPFSILSHFFFLNISLSHYLPRFISQRLFPCRILQFIYLFLNPPLTLMICPAERFFQRD